MAKQAATRATSTGTCNFCKEEIDKRKMTQHLKYCKQRAAAIAAEEQTAPEQKTRLFHLLVEGCHNLQYWMHLEVPASEPLETLDRFLRNIWLECCDHLSAFEIDGTNYSSEPENYFFPPFFMQGGEQVEEEEEVEDGSDEDEGDVVHVEEMLGDLEPRVIDAVPPDWLANLRRPWPIDDLVIFAKGEMKSIRRGPYPRTPEEQREYDRRYYQRYLLQWILDEVEDRTMDATLGRVLKVGQKFSHEYDFGSTTYLNLKVMSEREGVVQEEEGPVKVLARNSLPFIPCAACGERATQIASGYFNVEELGYCDKCARKSGHGEMMLPIVNSPRVGVCGYTGHSGYLIVDDEDDDFEDDEYLEEEEAVYPIESEEEEK